MARTLTRYLSEIDSIRHLREEEESAIGRRIADGVRGATHDLIVSHLRFVVAIARDYRNKGLPMEDLLSEGNLGLLHAASRFDHTRGTRFSTYAAFWVRKAIFKALGEQAEAVSLPYYQRRKLARRRAEGLSPDQTRRRDTRWGSIRIVFSLDETAGTDGRTRLCDMLVDPQGQNPERVILENEMLVLLRESLACLNARERIVIARRFGLNGSRATLQDLSLVLGISRERVRQIEMAALGKLRAWIDVRPDAEHH